MIIVTMVETVRPPTTTSPSGRQAAEPPQTVERVVELPDLAVETRGIVGEAEVRVAAALPFELLLPSTHCREQGMAVGKQVTIGFSAESVHVC